MLIAVAGAVMTTVIGDSMSRAFGLVGLGGFIRFRSGIKDPRDAAAMFVMIGVGMACGLGAASVAACATVFFGGVLLVLDAVSKRRMETVKLSLGLEDVGAAVPALKALHPEARFLSLEQDPSSAGGHRDSSSSPCPRSRMGSSCSRGCAASCRESSARPSIRGEGCGCSSVRAGLGKAVARELSHAPVLGSMRQPEPEGGSTPRLALHLDGAAMRLEDAPGHREPKAYPRNVRLGGGTALEGLEDALMLRGGDADSRIAHLHPGPVLRVPHRHPAPVLPQANI